MTKSVLAAIVSALPLAAQGETVWGQNRYVEYSVGTAPVVISAPHGGDLLPGSVADRTYGVVLQDRRTQEAARELADRFAAATGRRPHVVISHLHRSKLDPNREIVEAAQGDPIAIQAWTDFHAFCAQARATVQQDWGAGIYIDMHGHSHPEGWIELGYALDENTLNLNDAQIDTPSIRNASTIRALANKPGIWFPAVLRGAPSLGGALQSGGFDTVPSPVNPGPGNGNYFTGGFDVRRYGSRDGGTVDGLQIELPYSIREHRHTRAPFVDRTVQWLEAVFPTNWNTTPDAAPLVTIEVADGVASETGGTAECVVRRTGSTAGALAVPFTVGGTALAGVDYVALGAQVVIPAGLSEASIPITAINDGSPEGDETIEIRLTGAEEIGAANRAEVLVLDDDGDPYLSGWWRFDEGAGNAADSSGNGRTGFVEQGPIRVLGREALAMSFDGANDRLRIPDFAYAPAGDFSLAFWFRTSDTGGSYSYVFSHANFGVASSLNVYFIHSDGVLRTALVFANDLTEEHVLDVGRDLRDGAWHHYALTVDRDGLSRVTIDGEQQAVALFAGNSFDPSSDIYVGGRSDLNSSRFFDGEIDELRIYRRTLSMADVGVLYAGLGSDAAVHGGTGEDLALSTSVGGALTTGPRNDVKYAGSGSTVSASFRSPGGALLGRTAAIVLDIFPTGNPPFVPIFPGLRVDGNMIVVTTPAPLTPAGDSFAVAIPTGFAGISLMLQALAIDAGANNGIFAASDAHEIRLGP